jgi:hypothetical protein
LWPSPAVAAGVPTAAIPRQTEAIVIALFIGGFLLDR